MSANESTAQAPQPKPKRKLKTTSDVDRERIVTAYENGATPATIGQILNIRVSTVYGIIKRYQTSWQIEAKKRGGNHPKALSPEAIESIRGWFEADRTVTLRVLGEKLHEKHGLRVSSTTIGREVKELKAVSAPEKSTKAKAKPSKTDGNSRKTEKVKSKAQKPSGNSATNDEKSILKPSNK
ncbi:uncharacterized protein LOC118512727 [Anopheles stephensi]|uniref:uncharacterized protein LOC118512727 n=1 Tax=Anopheles stephensi TaxID=30069 RepID=UPI001658B037|nr:uncharacterized protein LOC118512727 [Anopheles stephensi]XP_035913481.1 uncharacterized protein LOC118512727 [Anopheles stephensi]